MNLLYSDIDMPVVDDKTIERLEKTATNYTNTNPACLKDECRKIEEGIMRTNYKSYKKVYFNLE